MRYSLSTRRLILAGLLSAWPLGKASASRLVVIKNSQAGKLGLPGGAKASLPQILMTQYQAFLLQPDPETAIQALHAVARTPSASEERSAARLLLVMLAQPSRMPASLSPAVSQGLGEENASSIAAAADSVHALAQGNAKLSLALLHVREILPEILASELDRAESLARAFYDAAKLREQAVVAVDSSEAGQAPQPRPAESLLKRNLGTGLAQPAPEAAPPAPARLKRKPIVPATLAETEREYAQVLATLEAMYAKQSAGYRDAFDSRRGLVYRIPYNDDAAAHISGLENRRADLEEAYPELARPIWQRWLKKASARLGQPLSENEKLAVVVLAIGIGIISSLAIAPLLSTPWSTAMALGAAMAAVLVLLGVPYGRTTWKNVLALHALILGLASSGAAVFLVSRGLMGWGLAVATLAVLGLAAGWRLRG